MEEKPANQDSKKVALVYASCKEIGMGDQLGYEFSLEFYAESVKPFGYGAMVVHLRRGEIIQRYIGISIDTITGFATDEEIEEIKAGLKSISNEFADETSKRGYTRCKVMNACDISIFNWRIAKRYGIEPCSTSEGKYVPQSELYYVDWAASIPGWAEEFFRKSLDDKLSQKQEAGNIENGQV